MVKRLFFWIRVANSILKNFTSSYLLDGRTFIISLSSYEREADKLKNSLNITVSK